MIKPNKLIFTSKLILFTKNNDLIVSNLSILDSFYEKNIVLAILARSRSISVLKEKIPEKYLSKIKFFDRSSAIRKMVIELKNKHIIIGLIGVVDEDAIFSFNCKIPLFNPERLLADQTAVSDKVSKYGLPILSYSDVIDCLSSYEIHKENYFHIEFSNNFSVISLNNANTYYRPDEEVRIKRIFETNLKGDLMSRDYRILLLLLFNLISEVTTNTYFNNVDFWGTFPSSSSDNKDTSVSFIKEAVRTLDNGNPRGGAEILIRKSSMVPKHKNNDTRLSFKCDKDFDTLKLNPDLKDKLHGKTICIIDDYITNGYSAESTKHILLNAGARKVIFLSFGKFGKKYFSTNYSLYSASSDGYSYTFCDETVHSNLENYNPNKDLEILSFGDLI